MRTLTWSDRTPFARPILLAFLLHGALSHATAMGLEAPADDPSARIVPIATPGPGVGGSPDAPPADASSSIDADGFLWGTEGNVNTKSAVDLPPAAAAARDAINGTLKTRFVKLRFSMAFFAANGSKSYSPDYCLPSAAQCNVPFNMDEVAKFYQANGWSMVPMFRHDETKTVTTSLIDSYVDFVDWFLGRYKATASIQMIELVNSPIPGGTWKGTSAQLVELTNKTYDRVRSKYPDIAVGTPGFEYWMDSVSGSDGAFKALADFFLDKKNGAKFDFWAFHGYALRARTGQVMVGPYPPTRTATVNPYAGIPGIAEIRARLDANGWQDRKIFDTEHDNITEPRQPITTSSDALDAAYVVQELVLKRTLTSGTTRVLSGALPLKIAPRGSIGEATLSSLNVDGSVTKHVKAMALLWSKLKEYSYAGHVSGAFDDETHAWVERFAAVDGRELYIFFKPFEYRSGQKVALDGRTLGYSLSLDRVPSTVTLTDVNGTTSSVSPSQTLTLAAENSPKYLELTFSQPADLDSRVGTLEGVPTLFVNSSPVPPTSLFVYNVEKTVSYGTAAWLDTFKGYVDQAKKAGITYVSFEVYLHDSMFKTPSQPTPIGSDLDFTNLDTLFDYARQQGIYLLPTLWVSNPPEWWAAAHQDEMQHSYDAPPKIDDTVSFNNAAYWQVMDEYVRAIVERYRAHPALLGWSPCVGVSRENNYGPSYITYPTATSWADYSPFAAGRFRAWLTEKYGSDAALQAAWHDASVTLTAASAPMPLGSVVSPRELVANGAGDTRPQMADWLEFRLNEKGAEWAHFIGLVKSLDPRHVLAINPAEGMLAPALPLARGGSADGLSWTRSPQVDMVLIHPRISFDETPGPWNTQNDRLFAFAASARRLGKLATFALEDNGEAASGGANVESFERIKSLSFLLAGAGSGIGWGVEAQGKLPVFSAVEIEEAAKYLYLFDPSRRAVAAPKLAMLFDPVGGQPEYTLGTGLAALSRSSDRSAFHAALFTAGVQVDPLETTEVALSPEVLDGYQGVLVCDLARLDRRVAESLAGYVQSGGGLFVGGRVGVLDSTGASDGSSLKALLGLSAVSLADAATYASWSLDMSGDPLLAGLSEQEVDTANPFYLPAASWSAEGYAELGHAAGGARPAALLAKGKAVVWLPRLIATNASLPVSLVKNWLSALTATSSTGAISSLQFSSLNPTSGNLWWAKAYFPADASASKRYPAVVLVPGGSGAGSADAAQSSGRAAAEGFVVVYFDADGRGKTPGTEDYCGFTHQDGLKALVEKVATLDMVDPSRVAISTGSYGITMGSGVLARYPSLPVKFLVDVEGPADRNDTGHCDSSNTGHIYHDCGDDAWWGEREAATFAKSIRVPYLRVQNVRDHVQPDNSHCILMIDNATSTTYGGNGVSPWTRVNLATQNQPNKVYSSADPPVYNPNESRIVATSLWAEMFASLERARENP